jgi:hypothetical protein
MTDPPHDSEFDPPFQPDRSTDQREFGYGKPPKHSQFPKGRSGNPGGRPKAQVGISIKEILDGDQLGKNGELVSRRQAFVIALVNDALQGNQKAFSKFMNLMNRSGLMRRETVNRPYVVNVPMRTGTKEEYDEHIRSMSAPPKRA